MDNNEHKKGGIWFNGYTPPEPAPFKFVFQSNDTNKHIGVITFDKGAVSFEGDADESALLFIEHMAKRWNEQWKAQEKRVEELEQRLCIKLPNVTTDRQYWTTWDWITHLGGRYQGGEPGNYVEFGSVFAVETLLTQYGKMAVAITLSQVKEIIRSAGGTIQEENLDG